jgi:prephenate dehydratase
VAAIAGKLAAELFGMNILVPNIHTLKNNYTRFLLLNREDTVQPIEGADKASVSFHTDHSRGSLARVLTKIADDGINLSKLQSFPIPDTDFKYSFHADMEFQDISQFEKVIEDMKTLTEHLKIFGIYRRGQWK